MFFFFFFIFHRLGNPAYWSNQMRQAVREEKWLADCEKDALKRDLEHATRRCEEMQQETTPQLDAAGMYVYDDSGVVVDGELFSKPQAAQARVIGIKIDVIVR